MVSRRHPSTVNSRRISAASRAGITAPPPPAPAAPQEVVPDQRPAKVATDRAAQGRLDGGGGDAGRRRWTRQRCACRHPARALRPWGSLMRHFLRPGRPPPPVGRLPAGVQQAAPTGLLVAPPRLTAAPPPRRPAARTPAVPLPPVAPRAHIHRPRAQVADEPPAVGPQSQPSRAWTPAPKPAMMRSPGASAPGLTGGRRCLRQTCGRLPRFAFPPIFSGIAPPIPAHRPSDPRLARDEDAAASWRRATKPPESRASQQPPTRWAGPPRQCPRRGAGPAAGPPRFDPRDLDPVGEVEIRSLGCYETTVADVAS